MASHHRTISRSVFDVLEKARLDAVMYHNPYITPEHVLFQMESSGMLRDAMEKASMEPTFFRERLGFFLSFLSGTDSEASNTIRLSRPLCIALEDAIDAAEREEDKTLTIFHLLWVISGLDNTLSGYLLRKHPEILDSFAASPV